MAQLVECLTLDQEIRAQLSTEEIHFSLQPLGKLLTFICSDQLSLSSPIKLVPALAGVKALRAILYVGQP